MTTNEFLQPQKYINSRDPSFLLRSHFTTTVSTPTHTRKHTHKQRTTLVEGDLVEKDRLPWRCKCLVSATEKDEFSHMVSRLFAGVRVSARLPNRQSMVMKECESNPIFRRPTVKRSASLRFKLKSRIQVLLLLVISAWRSSVSLKFFLENNVFYRFANGEVKG